MSRICRSYTSPSFWHLHGVTALIYFASVLISTKHMKLEAFLLEVPLFSRTGVAKLLNNWIKNWDNSVFVLAIKSL
jgi:hypothetical protein